MSFRVRVVLLLVLLVAISTAATAWLTTQQTTRRIADTVEANNRDVATAAAELAAYGRAHGTWNEVDALVLDLSDRFGLRLRLVTASGRVVSDSDVLRTGSARPVASGPIVVDPRPDPPELMAPTAAARYQLALAIAVGYRDGWSYATCLTEAGVDVRLTVPKHGIPVFAAVGDPTADCPPPGAQTDDPAFAQAGQRCIDQANDADCLRLMLAQRLEQIAPAPLQLYVGAEGEPYWTVPAGAIAAAAAAVALAASACAMLLSRRVVRPISALTAAARRLGSGDLTGRVPVTGRDEIAALGAEFNAMADRLAASEDRQRRLIADVAHELRTPLANLRGYLEGLADGVLRPDPQLFASLHEEALLQQRIIDDLQDLALAEAGALTYHRGPVELGELVRSCGTAHVAAAEAAGITLATDSHAIPPSGQRRTRPSQVEPGIVPNPTDIPTFVNADPDRLRQVLGNIIRNALAATPAGGRVSIGLVRPDAPGGFATIRIADTGCGISADDLPHVFERLWRADPARARGSSTGAGLGLAITSKVGTGTEVRISLPTIEAVPPGDGSIGGHPISEARGRGPGVPTAGAVNLGVGVQAPA